ncbi:MAG TPA: PCYCGC domain-containing protein, partial [Candidatus Paenibacillus intestinavium]|nr:PCYCGC domain-containing protein [Candidatus Paenibacillus intestinavium]
NQSSSQQSNSSSLMYLFLVAFALITLLAACGMDKNEHIHTVGSETWETTASSDELPTFLSDHTELTSDLYSHVGKHAHMMGDLPCYCGCMDGTETDEAHDSLLRCYWAEHPADDGSVTWTDHSTTCGVCKHEMEMVIEMSDSGSSLDEIKQAINAKYKQP